MKNSRKLLFILVTVMLVLGGTTAYAAVTGFTDIAGTTHEQSIIWAVDNGITIGYADGTFRPNNPNTRGQMATLEPLLQQPGQAPRRPRDGARGWRDPRRRQR